MPEEEESTLKLPLVEEELVCSLETGSVQCPSSLRLTGRIKSLSRPLTVVPPRHRAEVSEQEAKRDEKLRLEAEQR
ncbi:hypothetical protein PPTG_24763 [Phytophthora nicotianae INRA-310]|uniref:Uncharacterized protein n=1 Tax=Phytophthora nicotianae (strain INRA-310) TaxID=761204 RepID=W2PCQ5_PHYN3|nr:hypothetical protein PPTG_24763 [Phytophthora nicotianae INRA-310]ETM98008.1 hypothetical protein PPTG_24763 [Phytophthora nicotianae INRA-310]